MSISILRRLFDEVARNNSFHPSNIHNHVTARQEIDLVDLPTLLAPAKSPMPARKRRRLPPTRPTNPRIIGANGQQCPTFVIFKELLESGSIRDRIRRNKTAFGLQRPRGNLCRNSRRPETRNSDAPATHILASRALGCGGNTHTRRNQCAYYGGLRRNRDFD
jgi:hypothetical protein